MTRVNVVRYRLAFAWLTTIVTAVAGLLVVFLAASSQDGNQLLPIPHYLYSQTQGSLAHQASYWVLGGVVLGEIVLVWTANLGRYRWIVPVAVESMMGFLFGVSGYFLLRGYAATGACTSPSGCTIIFSSPYAPVSICLAVGIAFGVVWRMCWQADGRRIRDKTLTKDLSLTDT